MDHVLEYITLGRQAVVEEPRCGRALLELPTTLLSQLGSNVCRLRRAVYRPATAVRAAAARASGHHRKPPPSPGPPPKGGGTTAVPVGATVSVGTTVTVTEGVSVAAEPQVRFRSCRPEFHVAVSAAAAPSQVKVTSPPEKHGSVVGKVAGTSKTYRPPDVSSVAQVTPPRAAVMLVPSGAGAPVMVTVPL
jgi:hypothetical protein